MIHLHSGALRLSLASLILQSSLECLSHIFKPPQHRPDWGWLLGQLVPAIIQNQTCRLRYCDTENRVSPVCQIVNRVVDPVSMPDVKWIDVKATAARSRPACGDVVSGDPCPSGCPSTRRRNFPLPYNFSSVSPVLVSIN